MYSQYLGLCTAGHCYVVLAVFKILYCAILAVFWGSILWNTAVLGSILGFDTLEYYSTVCT